MTDIVVRGIKEDEVRDYLRCVGIGFHGTPAVTDERVEYSLVYMRDEFDQRLGAFVDGALCGTTGSFSTELTVPGGATVPLSAVTQVTVLPTHRRRGLLSEMMRTHLHSAAGRGEPVAMLIAAEWPIYGRFGYGMAVEAAATIIDSLTAELVDPSMRGSVEIVDLPVLRELAPPVFDAHRLRTPGAIHRNAVHWDLLVDIVVHPEDPPSKKRLHVIHRDPNGAVDGYAIYEPGEERWVHNRPQIAVTVSHLIATNDAAEADLWKYLCSIDWVSEVRANVRAVDEDLRQLFVNGRVARQADRSDHMWVRLVDTASALSARRYETPVSLVLDVRDRVFGDARYRLDGDATGASCTRTDDPADVELDVSVLGALYLGGTPLHPYALSGRVTERTEGAIDALDRGMRTARAPWATTSF